MTESTRQLKVAKLIQKELGDLFQREGSSYYGNAFVTLTKVKMTPDLGLAKVYLSFMLVTNKTEVLQIITSHTKEIRKSLGERIRKQVRIIPDLQFYIDDNLEYANQMDELFAKIKIPPKPEEPSSTDEDKNEED